jgi:hypothetical protein
MLAYIIYIYIYMVIKNAKQQVLDPNCLLTNREGRHNGCSTSEKKKEKEKKRRGQFSISHEFKSSVLGSFGRNQSSDA